jgi:hypothetical protein
VRCFTTGDPERFARLAERFSGQPMTDVQGVGTDELVPVEWAIPPERP